MERQRKLLEYWGLYMGGCENYGPFGVPIIIRHLVLRVPQKGTIILTTTHMGIPSVPCSQPVRSGL